MELLISPAGLTRCVYGEEIDLTQLGTVTIRRGSYVEPTEDGQWMVDLSPVGGPKLGPFTVRSAALTEEVAWLSLNWLVPGRHMDG
jgi:hypothetical protein